MLTGLLLVLSLAAFLSGALAVSMAKSSVQEIYSGVLWIISAILLSGAVVSYKLGTMISLAKPAASPKPAAPESGIDDDAVARRMAS